MFKQRKSLALESLPGLCYLENISNLLLCSELLGSDPVDEWKGVGRLMCMEMKGRALRVAENNIIFIPGPVIS